MQALVTVLAVNTCCFVVYLHYEASVAAGLVPSSVSFSHAAQQFAPTEGSSECRLTVAAQRLQQQLVEHALKQIIVRVLKEPTAQRSPQRLWQSVQQRAVVHSCLHMRELCKCCAEVVYTCM
jgi:hypothetical protein